MKKILTYGTFDILHRGHINLLKRAKEMGDHLTVGLSTDAFNTLKGKRCFYSYEERKLILEAVRYVDDVITENNWEQKIQDIKRLGVSALVMGDDWAGKFDELSNLCKVTYLPRTGGISTTMVKARLSMSGDDVDLSMD